MDYYLSSPQVFDKVVKTTTKPKSWVLHNNDSGPPNHRPPTHPQELNVSNVSPVTDPILTKLKSYLSETIINRCQVSRGHLSMHNLSWGHIMSISAISQLLLFPDQICPGDICPLLIIQFVQNKF